MPIDIESVRNQKKDLDQISDDILQIRTRIIQYKGEFDLAWKSSEKNGIDLAVEEIVKRLKALSVNISEIGRDVLITGQEIRQEQLDAEAAQRAEEARLAEEARKAEEERLEQERLEQERREQEEREAEEAKNQNRNTK